jgi:hypothetical protein
VNGVLLEKEFAKLVADVVDHFTRNGLLNFPARTTSELINGPAIYVRNDDASEAPPYACMQVVGTVEVGGQNYLKVDKPIDGDGTAGWFVFNGPNAIASGDFGRAFDGPLCRMLTDGSTVTAGGLWGPVASQWEIEPGGSLFIAAGEDDIADDVMRGFFKGGGASGGTGLAKTPSGGIPARSSITAGVATCTIAELYDDSGTIKIREKSPTQSVSIYNTTGVSVTGSAWIHWKTDGGRKVVDVDDCPGSSGGIIGGGTA